MSFIRRMILGASRFDVYFWCVFGSYLWVGFGGFAGWFWWVCVRLVFSFIYIFGLCRVFCLKKPLTQSMGLLVTGLPRYPVYV